VWTARGDRHAHCLGYWTLRALKGGQRRTRGLICRFVTRSASGHCQLAVARARYHHQRALAHAHRTATHARTTAHAGSTPLCLCCCPVPAHSALLANNCGKRRALPPARLRWPHLTLHPPVPARRDRHRHHCACWTIQRLPLPLLSRARAAAVSLARRRTGEPIIACILRQDRYAYHGSNITCALCLPVPSRVPTLPLLLFPFRTNGTRQVKKTGPATVHLLDAINADQLPRISGARAGLHHLRRQRAANARGNLAGHYLFSHRPRAGSPAAIHLQSRVGPGCTTLWTLRTGRRHLPMPCLPSTRHTLAGRHRFAALLLSRRGRICGLTCPILGRAFHSWACRWLFQPQLHSGGRLPITPAGQTCS